MFLVCYRPTSGTARIAMVVGNDKKVDLVATAHTEIVYHINVTGGRFDRTGPLAYLNPFPVLC